MRFSKIRDATIKKKTRMITSISDKAGIRVAEKRTRRKMGSTAVHGKILLVTNITKNL